MRKTKKIPEGLFKADPIVSILNYAWKKSEAGTPWFTLQQFIDDNIGRFTKAETDILDDTIGKRKEELDKFFIRQPGDNALSNRNYLVRINSNGYTTLFGYRQLNLAESTLEVSKNQTRLNWAILIATIIMLIVTTVMFLSQIKCF